MSRPGKACAFMEVTGEATGYTGANPQALAENMTDNLNRERLIDEMTCLTVTSEGSMGYLRHGGSMRMLVALQTSQPSLCLIGYSGAGVLWLFPAVGVLCCAVEFSSCKQ